MYLKKAARDRIIRDIVGCVSNERRKLMLCDEFSLNVLSSICKMKEILESGLSAVEPLLKQRQPLDMEAIYVVKPTEETIKRIIVDFEGERPLYKRAHIFTLTEISPDLINLIKNSKLMKNLKTLSEAYLNVLIPEENVFDLNMQDSLFQLYGEQKATESLLMEVASSISSICALLNIYPAISFLKSSSNCKMLADMIDVRTENLTKKGIITQKQKNTTILLLERYFDPNTPFVHELTIQALAVDLNAVENGSYAYKNLNGVNSTTYLDESNELWATFRHQHIAEALKNIPAKLKVLASDNKMKLPNNTGSLQNLRVMLTKLPQYKAQLNDYQVMLSLTEACFSKFESRKLEPLIEVEQELVTGTNNSGEPVQDPLAKILKILQSNYTLEEKLRIILLFAYSHKNGIPVDNLEKMLDHGKIKSEKALFSKLTKANIGIIEGETSKASINRKQEYVQGNYSLSRYVPTLKNILIESISDKLSPSEFTTKSPTSSSNLGKPDIGDSSGFKFGKWSSGNVNEPANTLDKQCMVFILGGATYSEVRCAYEVMSEKRCNILIGSTHFISPDNFLKSIRNL